MGRQKLGRGRKVLSRDRVIDRLPHFPASLKPARGPAMKLLHQLRRLEPKLRGKTGAKQMVVAVPVAALIERDDEQIRAREHLQLPRGPGGRQDRVTEW